MFHMKQFGMKRQMFHVKRSKRENFISKIVSRETIGI